MSLVILGVLCFVILLPAIRILAILRYEESGTLIPEGDEDESENESR